MEKFLVTGHIHSNYDVAYQILNAFALNVVKESLKLVSYEKELFSTAPNVNYILVYASPLLTLAKALENSSSVDEYVIAEVLHSWSEINTQILRFFYRHQNQCLLINIEGIVGNEYVFWDSFVSRFSINYVKQGVSFPQYQLLNSNITKIFANAFTYHENTLQIIYEELECVAQIHNDSSRLLQKEILAGWHNFHNLQINLKNQKKIINELEAQEQEKNLLLLQLQQVQDELKYYFTKAHQPTLVKLPSLAECVFNFCEDIDGTNWYYAEERGRWAGPLTNSTLKIPSMGKGGFIFELDIEHALDVSIVQEMKLYVNDVPCQIIAPNDYLFPLRIQVEFTSQEIDSNEWIIEFRFPRLVSPAELSNSKDERKLAIFVRSFRISKKRDNSLPLFLKYKQEIEHKYHMLLSENLIPQKKSRKINLLGFIKKIIK